MKQPLKKIAALALLLASTVCPCQLLQAQGTAFTYQGRLHNNGTPANGAYDLQVAVLDAATGGFQIGPTLTPNAVPVSNGLFTVTLDFGANVFTGANRWLSLAVKTNGAVSFTPLTPLQQITAAPYAITAGTVTGVIPAASLSGLYTGPVTLNNPGNVFNGALFAGVFTGNGVGLTGVNATTFGGLSPGGFWKTNGNTGTNPTNGAFIGTADNAPVEIRVNGSRALRLEPTSSSNTVNVIGGSSQNFVSPEVVGATIGGGGGRNGYLGINTNSVSADFSTVSGGAQNAIEPGAWAATIGGGVQNKIQFGGQYSTIGGGDGNRIGAGNSSSTISGGYLNAIESGTFAYIGGGADNTMEDNQYASIIGGGNFNRIQISAQFGTIAGGSGNLIKPNSFFATIPGGRSNSATNAAFAAGTRAKANHTGAFVWADSTDADFSSATDNQFLIRARGGVGINTNNPNGAALAVQGNLTVNGVITGSGMGLTGVPLGLASLGNALAYPGRFSSATILTLAGGASSATPFDNNDDGRLDLIVTDRANATVSVLTNDGHGGFAFATSASALAPSSVALADFNGDGKVDLVCGNNSYFGLSILLNNGSGGFAQSSTPVTGPAPGSVATTDINQDGWPDVVTANFATNTLSLLTNKGDGSFALFSTPVVGNAPASVLALDINADGKVDLISANAGSSSVSVLTNRGDGSLTLASSPTVGSNPVKAVAADVNGDGKVDLVTAGLGPDTLTVLTNAGRGVFVLAATLPVGTDPLSAATADINGDGRPDLISANIVDNSLSVLTNNGSGGFASAGVISTISRPNWITAADFNGDGIPDLAATHDLTNRLSVFFNVPAFAGALTGSGAELTGLNASSLSSGTLPDARLSANVALRGGGNAFTGTQTITGGSLGLGMAPQSTLHVNGTARIEGANNWGVSGGEGDFRVGNDSYRFKIGVANAGGGAGDVWMRAHGGIERINVKAPGGTRILSNETETSGVSLAAGGTAWAVISDRNVKKDFVEVDSRQILEKLAAMPITQWHYTWENSDATPHIGPMAQDFKAAFYPGTDDKSITTQEADGVAFAAIQGLNQKLSEQAAALKNKDSEIQELRLAVAELQKSVRQITQPTKE